VKISSKNTEPPVTPRAWGEAGVASAPALAERHGMLSQACGACRKSGGFKALFSLRLTGHFLALEAAFF
jgi:hypothetical protein